MKSQKNNGTKSRLLPAVKFCKSNNPNGSRDSGRFDEGFKDFNYDLGNKQRS